ncbi:PQQ-binding-like beta-propeller repeat protein [Deinococcus yavapaiensis]|uniref:Putative pyrroloquinoline-quinone binding quinoprotein n=1 Tax=Deinococcus yavapaiensis KR-236 TaxID=694435 RepID=A0A318S8B0_9DEIO|nr:PQQ-binding-like beta-propeller repeat protein [Deinococcus yavapaiensis]PYE51862.1 putative pyrroloquinoline-quinone binding quinoprotein [Deinococcus yavapaiensis KR-236]
MDKGLALLALSLLLGGCSTTQTQLPQQEYNYPALTAIDRDNRISAYGGTIASHDFLVSNANTSEIIPPELKSTDGIVFDRRTRQVVKSYPYSLNSNNALIVDDHLVSDDDKSNLVVTDLTTLRETVTPLSSLGDFFIQTGSTEQSFVDGDNVYMVFINLLAKYDKKTLLTSAAPQPIWARDNGFRRPKDSTGYVNGVAFDRNTKELFYTTREPFAGDDRYYNTWLFRLDENGKEISRFKIAEHLPPTLAFSKIAIEAGTVYVAIGGMKIQKYDLQGKLLWETPNVRCPGQETNVVSGLFRHGSTLLLMPDGDGCFFAFDTLTGKLKWAFESPNQLSFANRPLVLNGVVYAANGYMWALDLETGKILAMSQKNATTQGTTGTPAYDSSTNQIVLWGRELQFYKPLR